jgi:mannose-6-phosphate isomerase-like protein (cupin superfamily)
MADYTKKNLKRDVSDAAERFGLADKLEVRFGSSDLELEKLAFSYQRFGPGVRLPFGHKHNEQEEVYVVTEGSGRMKIEDEVIEIEQWDAIRVPAEMMRGFEGGDDGLELLAIGAPRSGDPREDAEPVPGWWSD